MMPALETRAISVSFGGVRAVNSVNLRVAAGERRVIIGPNGAGKTTFFNLLGGQVRPTNGCVLLGEDDITDMAPWRRARCGLSRTFQISRVFSNLTVWGNVMLAATGVNGLSGRSFLPANSDPSTVAWVDRLLDQWGLSSLKLTPVQQLSYGSQRLLEIALALATHPRVVLLDEPTAGLSSAERIMVTNRLVQLDRAVTMILTDHDMDVVFQVADRITVLNYGEVIADGDTKSVRADPRVREIYLGGS